MPISKRTRFEVLRRDGNRCRYCGATTAEGTGLTVDHVTPVALGGSDDPSNLVAACKDCNAGKTSTSPDAPLIEDVKADAIRWRGAMYLAAADMAVEIEQAARYRDTFEAEWMRWVYGYRERTYDLPSSWVATVDAWRNAGMPSEILVDSIRVAMTNHRVTPDAKFVYLCGVTRNRLEQITKAALVKANAPVGPQPCPGCQETPCCGPDGECEHESSAHCLRDAIHLSGWDEGYRLAEDRWAWHDKPTKLLVRVVDQGYDRIVLAERPWGLAGTCIWDPFEQVA